MDRRAFLKSAAAGAAVASIPLEALIRRVEAGELRPTTPDYGPLVPVADGTTGLPLLLLPEGFRYLSFGWTGDAMIGRAATPSLHDGMAAFAGPGGITRIVRNHEVGRGTPFSAARYDSAAGGGTTTVEFDTVNGRYISTRDSISGTIRNCAGGPTPWGTWLTCEETTDFTTMPHGYVFDVPADGYGIPVPIRDMGRFSHEAVAVDPKTNDVYLTEDTGNTSGFYRYVPHVASDPTGGGRLYMLKVAGEDNVNLYRGYPNNWTFPVEWVEIEQPDNVTSSPAGTWVSSQGRAKGAAYFGRLEGAWHDGRNSVYFVSTSCGAEFIHGLTVSGQIFKFAQNNVILNGERNGFRGNYTGSEFAGACYSPDGNWMFFNIQSPGISFAVTGPWREGAL